MFDAHGSSWQSIAADAGGALEAVLLDAEHTVRPADLRRISIAYFSGDVWPNHSSRFMRVALDAPHLAWLHVFNAGTDHPVFGQLRQRGVRLSTSSGASAKPVAHTVIMQLLAMTRNAPRWHRDQQARVWGRRDVDDMEGRTLVIVGLGAIGAEVARLAAEFGMRVVGVRRRLHGDEPCPTWPLERLDEALAVADDLVLAAPLNDDSRGVIGEAQLAVLRPGAHLVNVGRGELIDEAALIHALRDGRVAMAALDVFNIEPLPDHSPLWTMPNVIVTPHSAGTTAMSRARATEMFTTNLVRYLSGEPLINEVN